MPPLSGPQRRVLAHALGDDPQTVIAVHLLERALCNAYVVGPPAHFRAALIQAVHDVEEPLAFGANAGGVWTLLSQATGWTCVSVPEEIADDVGEAMKAATRRSIRFYGDLLYTMTTPVHLRHDDRVRYLTPNDLAMWDCSPSELHVNGFGSLEALLTDGVAAGAVVDGHLVAIAATTAPHRAPRGYRGQHPRSLSRPGLCDGRSVSVVDSVQRAGAVPVWSTGEANVPSQRVAEKLGFTPADRRTYLIPQSL
jgi:hypothetical protein